jgi:hypothetical protein
LPTLNKSNRYFYIHYHIIDKLINSTVIAQAEKLHRKISNTALHCDFLVSKHWKTQLARDLLKYKAQSPADTYMCKKKNSLILDAVK